MSVIKPFNGIVYNPAKVGDMNKVVCPPYDVISPEHEANLKKRSPYNYIHVMLAKADAKHADDDSRYAKAGETYQKWLKDGILVRDEKPCIYYTKQEYKVTGQRYSRMGFLAVMKIEEDRITPPRSRLEAISGRLAPLRSTTVVLSPSFAAGPGPL